MASVDIGVTTPYLDVPLGRVTTRRARRTSVSSRQYEDGIHKHATQAHGRSLYPGQIYEDLSKYLRGPSLLSGSAGPSDPDQKPFRSHARLYALETRTHGPPRTFSDPSECAKELTANATKGTPQILFLNGLSCPQWLAGIGSTLQVDPEFLNANMLYRCRHDYSAYPALPSAYENIIRLRLVTIGCRETVSESHQDRDMVERLRAEAKKQMNEYLHNLANVNMKCGGSVVRAYHVLGERHFYFEQEVAIYLHEGDLSWTALVCSDIGNSLTEGIKGPWLSDSNLQPGRAATTSLYPTIQHRKKVAFRSKPVAADALSKADLSLPQTATLLSMDYGRLLDCATMALDPFYALHDLYRFALSGDTQLLNLVEFYVRMDTGHESLSNDNLSISNLVYYRELLESYINRLRENTEVIRRRGGSLWPRVSEKDKGSYAKADAAAEALLRDCEVLRLRAQSICQSCERGMNVIMNKMMLAESKRAIAQARRVARLTFIAFVYIPLSFTTSFFGMNIQELGTGSINIWVWIATSVPVLLVTMIVFFFNWQRIKATAQSFMLRVIGPSSLGAGARRKIDSTV